MVILNLPYVTVLCLEPRRGQYLKLFSLPLSLKAKHLLNNKHESTHITNVPLTTVFLLYKLLLQCSGFSLNKPIFHRKESANLELSAKKNNTEWQGVTRKLSLICLLEQRSPYSNGSEQNHCISFWDRPDWVCTHFLCCHHSYNGNSLFPDHLPEILACILQRALCSNVIPLHATN